MKHTQILVTGAHLTKQAWMVLLDQLTGLPPFRFVAEPALALATQLKRPLLNGQHLTFPFSFPEEGIILTLTAQYQHDWNQLEPIELRVLFQESCTTAREEQLFTLLHQDQIPFRVMGITTLLEHRVWLPCASQSSGSRYLLLDGTIVEQVTACTTGRCTARVLDSQTFPTSMELILLDRTLVSPYDPEQARAS